MPHSTCLTQNCAWNKEDKRLRRQKLPKVERPQAPPRDKKCPTKQQIALQLIAKFKNNFPEISIKAIVTDALYGDSNFVDNAHKKKRFVIAIKYSNEANYRYIVASNLAWRTRDIANAYFLRWLIEVFIEDWKLYEGWRQLTKQPGVDGSSRSLILHGNRTENLTH